MNYPETENIHIQANKVSFNYHVYLLFLPAIIFVIVMAIIIRSTNSSQVAQSSQDAVLGNTAEEQK